MSTTATATTATTERPAKKRKAPLSEGAKAERRLGWLLCAPAVIIMVAVTGYPILYAVYLSFRKYDLHFPSQAHFIGFGNYTAVLKSPYFWQAFWVTLIITVVSVAIEFVLGMALALLMHRTLVGRGDRAHHHPDPLRHRDRGRGVQLAVRLDAQPGIPVLGVRQRRAAHPPRRAPSPSSSWRRSGRPRPSWPCC